MTEQHKRIQLLPCAERDELYAIPEFNDSERELYFTLTEIELKNVNAYETIKTRSYFILQLGYFKAKQQFFTFTFEDVSDDIAYVGKRYFNNKLNVTGDISIEYLKKQRQHILRLFDYRTWSLSLKPAVKNHLSELIKTYPKIHNMFRHLLTYFDVHRIILPSYRTLQDAFTEIVKLEKIRLCKCLEKLSEDDKSQLEKLIKNNDGITQLNVIRADQKNFKYAAIKLEVEKVNQLSKLYQSAKLFIPTLQLSNNAIRYYADIAEQYAAFRLRRLSKSQQFLHLICFVFYRYQQLTDNLITSFMYCVRLIKAEEKEYLEKAEVEHASKLTMQLTNVSKFLRWFPKQKKAPDVTYAEFSKEAYKILPEEQFDPMAEFISGESFNKKAAKQTFYSKALRKISLYLRPILLAVDFDYCDKNHIIVKLIELLKTHYATGKSPAALKITDELEQFLSKKKFVDLKLKPTDKTINLNLLESYVYQKMYHYIDRGQLCCNDSVSYKDLKNDLVSDEFLDRIEEITTKLGYLRIPVYCDDRLHNMINKLDKAWETTMENIASGNNTGIKIIPGHTCKLFLMSDVNEVDDNNLYLSVDEKNKKTQLLYKTKKANGKTINGVIDTTALEQNSFSCIVEAVKQKNLGKISKNDKNKLLTITVKRSHTIADKDDDWTLLYDASETLNDEFFNNLQKIEITQLIKCIGDKTGMLKAFTHNKNRYVKRDKPAETYLNAGLLAEAFGISMEKMSDMCDLNSNILQAVHDDFFRIETLCDANDIVANFIHGLPIFKFWNLYDKKLLADADGQKHATSDSTIQSRFSKKYVGKGKGISLYTLIANFVPVNQKNIGLNEYEGHSLYDMIYGNRTDIDIDMVTGDNHSMNKLNFMLLDSINVEYVPSIKNIREAANELYSVKPTESYAGLIKPKGKINIGKIRSQKREILRVLLSLLLQKNTQNIIIRKLNSQSRYTELKAACLEYNKIFNSIHVLKLIDDMQFRKSLRTARNRTESYHQSQSFVRKAYHGIFKGKRIIDNRISAHATRLLVNCIVAYNSLLLNAIYEKLLATGASEELLKRFGRISPIAWAHFMFTGQFSFQHETIDMNILIKELEAHMAAYFD